MITPTRQAKNFIALFLLGCLVTCLSSLVGNAQSDEQAGVRHVVEQFFAAFQKKDLPGVMALWSEKSPDLVAGRQTMQQTFARYRTIEVKNPGLDKITVETNKATVQLIGELSVVRMQMSAPATALRMSWTIELVKETGGWKILSQALFTSKRLTI